MAQEKARAPRAQKVVEPEAAAEKTTAKKASAAGKTVAPKAGARSGTAAAARKQAARERKLQVVAEPTPEAIAVRAYLLWESGEPGDQTEHWLRAEAEFRAA
jgi:hypothetical protein